jgi:hypothetical protein
LPEWEEIEDKQLPYKKLLIGKFMGDIYGMLTLLSTILATHLALRTSHQQSKSKNPLVKAGALAN